MHKKFWMAGALLAQLCLGGCSGGSASGSSAAPPDETPSLKAQISLGEDRDAAIQARAGEVSSITVGVEDPADPSLFIVGPVVVPVESGQSSVTVPLLNVPPGLVDVSARYLDDQGHDVLLPSLVSADVMAGQVTTVQIYPGVGTALLPVTLDSTMVHISLRDDGEEDGDRINLLVNDVVVVPDLSLTNAEQSFDLLLNPGENTLTVEALNEGSVSPNTASISLSNVISGPSVQSYALLTGQKASFVATVVASGTEGDTAP